MPTVGDDPRSRIPRTDALLAGQAAQQAQHRLSGRTVRGVVEQTQQRARRGEIAPEAVEDELAVALGAQRVVAMRPVINATGVIIHTNLGRAPLSPAAVEALVDAAGYVDVELDLNDGVRSKRGVSTRQALLEQCPAAQEALVVNNGAAAMVLATTALATGREVVVSRGELIEIGAGFRLPDLIASTGAILREVGMTNRTHLADYVDALGENTGCLLKVHPSNYRVEGFTASVGVEQLAPVARDAGVPLIVDLGSGLLRPDALLPDEPDAATTLAAGADLITASGDKLLGGTQAGILLGRKDIIDRIAKHPLARAVRADKLTLAAIEATVRGATAPTTTYLHADPAQLRARATRIAEAVDGEVVPHDGRVGGGGAPGLPLPGWAVSLPEEHAKALRLGDPAVLPRVHAGRCLIDPRCVPIADDDRLIEAVRAAVSPAGA